MSWGSSEGYVGTEVGANGRGSIVYLFLNGLGGQDCAFDPNTFRVVRILSTPDNLGRPSSSAAYFCATKVAIVQRCQW